MAKAIGIPVRGAQGTHSRQAHADMPEGTFEREISKEGFYGPAAFMHHPKPPTGWTSFEGPLRPRAFDLINTGSVIVLSSRRFSFRSPALPTGDALTL